MKIAFLFRTNGIFGGNFIAYQHGKFIQENGHDVSLIFEIYNANFSSAYDFSSFNVLLAKEAKNTTFDLIIATYWSTALTVLSYKSDQYAYFIQSDERRFFDESGSPKERVINRYLAECTYRYFPGHLIVIAKWLQEMLKNEFNRESSYVPNGINLRKFSNEIEALSPLPREKLRVLVEGATSLDYKRIEFTHSCLSQFSNEIETWHVSSDSLIRPYWNINKTFNAVSHSDMPKIMRSCDLLIKLSIVEGFYLPPLEMFACGGTVLTSNVTGHEEYIINDNNGFVVSMDNYGEVVNKLKKIINGGRKFLKPYKLKAHATAKKFDIENLKYNILPALEIAFKYCKDRRHSAELDKIFREYNKDSDSFYNNLLASKSFIHAQ